MHAVEIIEVLDKERLVHASSPVLLTLLQITRMKLPDPVRSAASLLPGLLLPPAEPLTNYH